MEENKNEAPAENTAAEEKDVKGQSYERFCNRCGKTTYGGSLPVRCRGCGNLMW